MLFHRQVHSKTPLQYTPGRYAAQIQVFDRMLLLGAETPRVQEVGNPVREYATKLGTWSSQGCAHRTVSRTLKHDADTPCFEEPGHVFEEAPAERVQ